jgi:hypothetical protein
MLGGSYGYECTFKSQHVYKKKVKIMIKEVKVSEGYWLNSCKCKNNGKKKECVFSYPCTKEVRYLGWKIQY